MKYKNVCSSQSICVVFKNFNLYDEYTMDHKNIKSD